MIPSVYVPPVIRPCPWCEFFAVVTFPVWGTLLVLIVVGAVYLRVVSMFWRVR